MVFQDNVIRVSDLKRLWPDEAMEHLNYCKVMLIFDKEDGYSDKEYDEIYDWFKNIIK